MILGDSQSFGRRDRLLSHLITKNFVTFSFLQIHLRLNLMAIYRTRAHYDIDALKYEHEYIINHYSDWFRGLRIQTFVFVVFFFLFRNRSIEKTFDFVSFRPEYSINKDNCKYKFKITPHGRTIPIEVEATFGDNCTDATHLRFVAECFDDSRTSNSRNRRSSSIHHRRHSSKRSYRISSSSQNSRSLAE